MKYSLRSSRAHGQDDRLNGGRGVRVAGLFARDDETWGRQRRHLRNVFPSSLHGRWKWNVFDLAVQRAERAVRRRAVRGPGARALAAHHGIQLRAKLCETYL